MVTSSRATCRNSGWILLNCVPDGVDVEELELRLLGYVPSVASVHELHVWTLSGK
jgi:Co/Zn/Cd efflux system component